MTSLDINKGRSRVPRLSAHWMPAYAGMTSFPRKRESRTMRRRNYAHASCKMRHHSGGKQLHAAHDSVVRDHAAGVEPTDHPTHVELLLQPFQPFHARLRRVEDCHHLAHLLIRHPTNALQNFLDASGPSVLPPVVGRVERSDRL